MQTTFVFETAGPGLLDITGPVEEWVARSAARDGLLTLFLRHTSASLLVQENADPAVRADLEVFLRRLVPWTDDPTMAWITHRDEGIDDMPAHIRAALLPVSLQIPVEDGRLRLGTWQAVYLVEHRARPHRREIAAHLSR